MNRRTFGALVKKLKKSQRRRNVGGRPGLDFGLRVAVCLYRLANSATYRNINDAWEVRESTICEWMDWFCRRS